MPVPRSKAGKIVRVPGNARTLARALDLAADPTQRVEIVFERGYVIDESTTVDGRDFRHVTLRAEDAVVPADDSGAGDWFGFLTGARGAHLPTLDCLIDMRGGRRGLKLTEGSTGIVLARADHRTGIINAGEHNLFVYRGSSFIAAGKREEGQRCEFAGAGTFGLFCYRGSWASVPNADFSGAAGEGIRAKSDSRVAANESIIRDCGDNGVHADSGARIGVSDHAVVKGSGRHDLAVSGQGEIIAHNCDFGTMNRRRWFAAWPLGSDGRIYT